MIPCIASFWFGWSIHPTWAWMGQALLYGTLLAGMTWIFVRLFRRRIPSSIQAMLWCIVLVKFIAPTGPQCSLSLASFCESLWPARPATGPMNHKAPPDLGILELAPQDAIASSQTLDAKVRVPWQTLLSCVYGAFVLALMIRGLLAYRALRKKCLTLPNADVHVMQRVRLACEQLGVRRVPSAYVTTNDDAPFVLGGWKPLLVLSHRHLSSVDLLDTVVVHEVAHLRRGDFIVRYIQWIAGSLLFFWPVVSWVNRQIDLARENACDEWALRHGKLSAADYARCLLDAVKHRSFKTAAYHPACMAANPATIERRIDMILQSGNMRRGSAWVVLASVVVAAWGGFTLAGSANDNQKGSGDVANEQPVAREQIEVEAIDGAEVDNNVQLLVDAKYKTEQWFSEVRDRVRAIAAADTDGDGEVSNEEITYYLATKSLADPASVIEAYPFADLNRDGELSAGEALYFASGKRPLAAVRSGQVIQADGGQVVVTDSEGGVTLTAGSIEVGSATGETKTRRVRRSTGSSRLLELHSIAGRRLWILEHGDVEPTVDELAEAALKFEQVVAEQYLAAYPDADEDLDGMLTVEERRRHQQEMELQEFMDANPEADANSDGVLTFEEQAAYSAQSQDDWKRRKEMQMIELNRSRE